MSNAVASARRRVRLCAVLVLVLSAGPLTAQYTPYATRTQFLQTPAGVGPMGLLGYVNPAVLGRLHAAETAIAWSPQRAGTDVVNDWGLYSALPHVGFGVVRRHGPGGIDFSEYRLGLGGGNGSASGGVGWGWSSGDGAPDPVWLVGGILQPSRWLSFGATWTATTNGDIHELAGHLGWRPLASPRLSLFAAAAHGWDTGDASYWSGGADVQLAEGFHVTSRYVDGGTLHLGARLEFGTVGVSTQSQVRSRRSGDDIQSVHVLR
ncbi:MAG: hypothetical protein O2782_00890, partial [bacterium]|nr:hypothetical protein [bacterium]